MKKNKYDEMIPVCWRDVLRCLDWALIVRRHSAERWIDKVEADIEHSYPDYLEHDIHSALGACECVFYHFELLNTLRRFLRYKPKDAFRAGVQRCYDFYEQYKKESPCSGSLSASTTRGQDNG